MARTREQARPSPPATARRSRPPARWPRRGTLPPGPRCDAFVSVSWSPYSSIDGACRTAWEHQAEREGARGQPPSVPVDSGTRSRGCAVRGFLSGGHAAVSLHVAGLCRPEGGIAEDRVGARGAAGEGAVEVLSAGPVGDLVGPGGRAVAVLSGARGPGGERGRRAYDGARLRGPGCGVA